MKFEVGQTFYMRDKVVTFDKKIADVKGLYKLIEIEENETEPRYHIRDIDSTETFIVSGNVLRDNRMLVDGKMVKLL